MGRLLKGSFCLGAALVACLLAAGTPAQEKAPPARQTHSLRAGLVLLDDRAAYAVNPEGGIDVVDLQTGKLLWSTQKGSYWPLAVQGNLLLARRREPGKRNVIRVSSLDLTQKGKVVKESGPIEFPAAWVGPGWNDPVSRYIGGAPPRPIPPGPQVRYEVRLGGGKLLMTWEASWEAGLLPPGIRQEHKGLVEVSLAGGGVRLLPSDRKLAPVKEPKDIVVGQRKLLILDVMTRTEPGKGIITTRIVPVLHAIDTRSGKEAWRRPLRGGSTTTVNYLAP
jgi:hypothetical protein